MRTVFFLVLLASFYSYLVQIVPTFSLERWQAIALFNFGLVLLLSLRNSKAKTAPIPPHGSQGLQLIAWASPLIILIFVVVLIYFSPRRIQPNHYSLIDLALLCVVIPTIEELLFRRYITSWLYESFEDSPGLVILTSALIFALAHAAFPKLIVPLGPYLLGLTTASLYMCTGRVLTPILFHSVCNASAVLFSYYAPAWLDRLAFLYLKL